MYELTTEQKLQIIHRWSNRFTLVPTTSSGGGTNWWCNIEWHDNDMIGVSGVSTPVYETQEEAINRCLEILSDMVWERIEPHL